VLISPELQRHVGKYYGKYSGQVTKNEDKDTLGRITVKVPSVFGPTVEVPARPCFPPGHFFVPPVDAFVWVEFEAGDPNYPLWVGTWYPTSQVPPEAAITPPDNHVIQTPAGHTIQIMDKDGEEKIVIKHKSNAFVSIDKDGSVVLANKNGANVFLNAKDKKLTITDENSNMIMMTSDDVAIIKGGSMIQVKDDTALVRAKTVIVEGQSVGLGPSAMEPAVLGLTFAATWNIFATAHTHVTALGPSGPPLPPGIPLAPKAGLSTTVTVA
jgi:hypothetical protein